MSYNAMQLPANAVEALLCGGIHAGYNRVMPAPGIGSAAYTFGISAASDYAGCMATQLVGMKVSGDAAAQAAYYNYVKPLASGAIYVGLARLASSDGSSSMRQFLVQVGSSVGSSFIAQPVRKALGV